jgi:hypothetical protein
MHAILTACTTISFFWKEQHMLNDEPGGLHAPLKEVSSLRVLLSGSILRFSTGLQFDRTHGRLEYASSGRTRSESLLGLLGLKSAEKISVED